MKPTVLVALLGVASLLPELVLSLRISAFNIRTFGDAKMSNNTISNLIVQVSSLAGGRPFLGRGAPSFGGSKRRLGRVFQRVSYKRGLLGRKG